ncbi:MAG: glycosyltransferase [bacterium]|nr:glycosyltransferase [bacterium]
MTKILTEIKVGRNSLLKYEKFIKADLRKKILAESEGLKGVSVVHINSTACGGGVAELLQSQIPLERGLGIDSHWVVINGDKEDMFFTITKKIHNLLQGEKGTLTENEKKLYLRHNKRAFPELKKILKKIKPDIVVIHDPQPLPLVGAIPRGIKVVFRLHIDISAPNARALNFIKPFITEFNRIVVSNPLYRPEWFPKEKTDIIYPAIDPLLPKNKILSRAAVRQLAKKYGINPDDKIVSQVSRFDPWKDPVGVIKAFNIARKKIAGLKLILIGSVADDDPESKEIYAEVKDFSNGDPDILLITKKDNTLVNVIQSASGAVLQKSLREGFGLTVTEAMWKGKAVIGGDTIGIASQIEDGKNGFLVSSIKRAGEAIIKLVGNPKLAKKMGAAARKTVQEKFLTPAMVLEHLKLYSKLLK